MLFSHIVLTLHWAIFLIFSQGQAMEMTSSVVMTPLKSPIGRSPLKSPAPDKALEEAKSAYKQCQEEYEKYRTEMKEQIRWGIQRGVHINM